ncbi:Glycosyltransferase involved in cell wall bisynthesis [Lentzea albidocapillata]|uniref:Glycosyltransferase involved in cell wall bisynthesis n=2 Tax=Lentzea albidocapillata TaxID=40571 RepID=A0A1W2F7N7_9PSEU|nr:Glycosyltransferase involved in cell wall bisynthesis [Lentzea albidocapillata]
MVLMRANPLTALRDQDVTGQSLHVAKLSEALRLQGHDLTIYTRRTEARLPDRMRVADGLEVVQVPAGPARQLDVTPHVGEFARSLQDLWSSDVPDLIHAHHWTSGLAAVLGARHSGIPVVQSYHTLQGGDSTAHERLVGRAATCVIATSGHETNELARLGVRRSKISAVPWGVDLQTFTPNGPSAPRNGMPRILTVGGLAPHDGVDDLIGALTTVSWTELVIAGGPSSSRPDANLVRLRELADRCGVAHRVTFLGRVPHADVPPLIRSADVVACPQRHEPFGIVPIEAMACGVPVVATAVGGLAETVVHGVTGLHVPPREPAALGRALRSLLANDVRRQEMSCAAEDRARVRYDWQRIALEMDLAYQRVGGPAAGRTAGREVIASVR